MVLKYIFKSFLIPLHLDWNPSRDLRDVYEPKAIKATLLYPILVSIFMFSKSFTYFLFHFPEVFHSLRESNIWMKKFVTHFLVRKVVLMSKNNICKLNYSKELLDAFYHSISLSFGIKTLFKNLYSQIPLRAGKQKSSW